MGDNTKSITLESVYEKITESPMPLVMTTDVIRLFGYMNVDSHHFLYRQTLRALNTLTDEKKLGRYYIPEANITVFFDRARVKTGSKAE